MNVVYLNQSGLRVRRARCNGIVVVGGHPLVREGLKDLLGNEPALVICGEAANRSEALSAIERSSVGMVGAGLKPGTHVIRLYEPYIIPGYWGIIYDNTWVITVPQK